MQIGAAIFFTDYSIAAAELGRELEARGVDTGPLLAQEYICIGEFTPFLLELHTAVKGLLLFLYVCKRRRLHLDIFPAIIDFIFTLLEVCARYE